MKMGREWRNNGGIGDYLSTGFESPCPSSSSSSNLFPFSSPPPSLASSSCSHLSGGVSVAVGVGVGGANYIEHTVSKFDTLAGVAIKYGVEVADIKKINGLATDLQMFALKTLHIPLPGRHPPSPILANGHDTRGPTSSSEKTPPRRRHSDLFNSFESLKLKSSSTRKVSPAMNNLQGYYRLTPPDQKAAPDGIEMGVYQNGGSHFIEDGAFGRPSPHSNPPLSLHRKCKSVANGFKLENGDLLNDVSSPDTGEGDSDNWIKKMVRRRQKSVADFSRTPELLLKEDNSNSSSGGFSSIAGKGLALRPKAASRIVSGADGEAGTVPTAVGEFSVIDNLGGVRKSSSTSSLQESDNSSSIWPTVNWSLKQDFQSLSTAAIARPIFDSLPKPMTSRKNKTAVD